MLQRIYSANLCDRLDSDVSGRMTLSHRLNHFPPLTPFSRVANMRSVHIDVSTHFHFSDIWVSDFCLAISTISLRFFSQYIVMFCASTFLSYFPPRGFALHTSGFRSLQPEFRFNRSHTCHGTIRILSTVLHSI